MSEFVPDINYMKRALFLAEKGKGHTSPNPMVGAVIVKNDRIIGEGYHEKCGSAHAEINAFNNSVENVEGADMYVTLEPCSHYGKTPPCADKIIEKKIKRVIIAAKDPNPLVSGNGIKKLQNAGIEVYTDVLENESIKLNEVFMKYIINKEPFVTLKFASSLDGKIATYSGKSRWITNEKSRDYTHTLRGIYSGIMVGVGTILADNPMLNCRKDGYKNPVRIIVDSVLSTPIDYNVITTAKDIRTIFAVTDRADINKINAFKELGAEVIVFNEQNNKVPIKELMSYLGQNGIDSILVEGGGTLSFSMLEEKCVDKVMYFTAPIIIGGNNAKNAVAGKGFENLFDCIKLKNIERKYFDNDILTVGYI